MQMTSRSTWLSMLGALALAGCAATGAESPRGPDPRAPSALSPSSSPRAAATTRRGGPLSSSFEGPSEPVAGRPITLRARLVQRVALNSRARVTLTLPPDVSLLEGRADQWLEASSQPGTRELTFVLSAGELPSEDALLTIDVRGDGFGYHAEHPYRFGRPEPLAEAPVRGGPELRMGKRKLGKTIPLTK